jgi:hypothetical protein
MLRFFVQSLEESSVNRDRAPWFQDAEYFSGRQGRILQVLENIQREDAIEDRLAKREMMGVSDNIGVTKNLVFELNAVRKPPCRSARPDMEDEIATRAQEGFELRRDRIAHVILCVFHRARQKDRHAVLQRERRTTPAALHGIGLQPKLGPAHGTDQNLSQARR